MAMRLAVEVTTCTALRAGIGYYTEHLVDALLQTRAPGDEVVLLSNQAPAADLARRWGPYLKIGGSSVRALWLQKDVPGMLAESGADVAAFPNYIVPLAAPCRTISFVHDLAILRTPELFTWRKRVVTQALLAQSVLSAAAVATVSEASRRDIIDRLGVNPERVILLPGAAHPSCGPVAAAEIAAARARHGLTRPYLLTVGTIEPRKNLLTLLGAFDEMNAQRRTTGEGAGPDEEIDLVVVGGRGWRDRHLLEELKSRTTLGRVRWLGYIPENELIALYGGARLFVYPSRLEGFGLPVLEAMSCGAPVVASDVAALREVAGDAAVFVPPGEVTALAEAMAGLLGDPARAERMRARGFERARSFSWARTAERLWRLAEAVAPTRHRPLPERIHELHTAPELTANRPSPIGAPAPGLSTRQWAVLATVTYADLFESPLSVEDAETACIGVSASAAEIRRAVCDPALAAHVTLHPGASPAGADPSDRGDYLALAGRDELVARRPEGVARTAALLEAHRRILDTLASLPFVRMLAFSGGTAHQNPGRKPDIDLFVITAPERLYLAYSLIFLFTKVTRTRAVVCPNYLIDESELAIVYHPDLFTAHQVMSARPICGSATYQAFFEANERWVRRFYPASAARAMGEVRGNSRLQRHAERALAPLAAPAERLLRAAWRFHLGRHAAKVAHPDVVLANGILKLHLSDYRRRVLQRFAARLEEVRAQYTQHPQRADSADEAASEGVVDAVESARVPVERRSGGS
jgi:glycosyltransferase involved in cell wall biosynthesis